MKPNIGRWILAPPIGDCFQIGAAAVDAAGCQIANRCLATLDDREDRNAVPGVYHRRFRQGLTLCRYQSVAEG